MGLRDLAAGLGLIRRAGDGDPTPFAADVTPPARTAGLTEADVFGIDAFYRCIFIIQTAVAQLGLDAWRSKELLDPAPPIVRRPNIDMHRSGFVALTATCLAARGNAFWKVSRGPDNQVNNLVILDPARVGIETLDREVDNLRYWYRGKRYTPSEIIHVPLMRVPGTPFGLGPVQAARQALTGILAVRQYADLWLDEAHVPNGILSTDQPLSAAQAADFKKQWIESQKRHHEPAVLSGGMKYEPLMLSPAEIQWLDAQQWGVTSTGRLLGIPAHMLNVGIEGGARVYANVEQEGISLVRYTFMRYLNEIEQALTAATPHGTTVRFNADALMRSDTKTRYEAHAVAIESGFLTVNEVRAIEGLPPLPEKVNTHV